MQQDNEQHRYSADANAKAPSEQVSGPRTTFKERLLKKDGKRFKKYIESTTAHGVVHIFVGKSVIRRLFWLVIFLGAAGGCLYNITDRILYLADQPTATTISVSRPGSLTFPVLTVCNQNLVRRSYLESLNVSDVLSTILLEDSFNARGKLWCQCVPRLLHYCH